MLSLCLKQLSAQTARQLPPNTRESRGRPQTCCDASPPPVSMCQKEGVNNTGKGGFCSQSPSAYTSSPSPVRGPGRISCYLTPHSQAPRNASQSPGSHSLSLTHTHTRTRSRLWPGPALRTLGWSMAAREQLHKKRRFLPPKEFGETWDLAVTSFGGTPHSFHSRLGSCFSTLPAPETAMVVVGVGRSPSLSPPLPAQTA